MSVSKKICIVILFFVATFFSVELLQRLNFQNAPRSDFLEKKAHISSIIIGKTGYAIQTIDENGRRQTNDLFCKITKEIHSLNCFDLFDKKIKADKKYKIYYANTNERIINQNLNLIYEIKEIDSDVVVLEKNIFDSYYNKQKKDILIPVLVLAFSITLFFFIWSKK